MVVLHGLPTIDGHGPTLYLLHLRRYRPSSLCRLFVCTPRDILQACAAAPPTCVKLEQSGGFVPSPNIDLAPESSKRTVSARNVDLLIQFKYLSTKKIFTLSVFRSFSKHDNAKRKQSTWLEQYPLLYCCFNTIFIKNWMRGRNKSYFNGVVVCLHILISCWNDCVDLDLNYTFWLINQCNGAW